MMATRVEGAPQGATPPSSSLRERGLGRRVVFLIALATCSVLCTYSALGLLARVTPALFPGYNLPGFVTETIPSLGPILPGPEAPDENSAFTRRRNLLIIGLDKLRDEPFDRVYRTDTIMVATLEPNAKQAAILAFPRDLLIDIDLPAYAPPKDRINTSYYYGYISTDEDSIERGAEQLVHDMKRNFGIEIDYWVIVDFVGVQEIINAVGGICITVPEDLEVPLWRYSDSKDPSTITYVEFPPGPQCLDGYHSVAFGRNRGGELGDLGRIRRQHLAYATPVIPWGERSEGVAPPGVPLEEMVALPGTPSIKDGYVKPSDSPGFGIEVTKDWLEGRAV